MGNTYAYLRISTKEERRNQKFTRQEVAMQKYEKETGTEICLIFREDESGKTFKNRGVWRKLESIVKEGDTIVFKAVDRFTRNVDEGLEKYNSLMNRGVSLIFLDNPTLSTSYMKNLLNVAENQEDRIARESLTFVTRIILIAELDRCEKERERISQRTKDGIAAKKAQAEANGETWNVGRKTGQLDKLTPELERDLVRYISDRSVKMVDIMRKHQISRNTAKKYVERIKNGEEL